MATAEPNLRRRGRRRPGRPRTTGRSGGRPHTAKAERALPAGGGPACRGEERARLGAVLQSLEPRLTAVATRFTRDPESARDVVQNAFEKALRHYAGFRGEARLSTWMHRIVANEAMMWLRSERRRAARKVEVGDWEGTAFADPAPAAPDLLERRQRDARVRSGLVCLRADEREVLLRCVFQDQSYAQAGAETGLHPAALKSRAFRARQRLSAILAEEGAPGRPERARGAGGPLRC